MAETVRLSLVDELEVVRSQHPGCTVRVAWGGKVIEVTPPDPRLQRPIAGIERAEALAEQEYRQRLGQLPLMALELDPGL
jgi:hypothetical protein